MRVLFKTNFLNYVKEVIESLVYVECIEYVRALEVIDKRINILTLEDMFKTAVIEDNPDGSFEIQFYGSSFLVHYAESIFNKLFNDVGKYRIIKFVEKYLENKLEGRLK